MSTSSVESSSAMPGSAASRRFPRRLRCRLSLDSGFELVSFLHANSIRRPLNSRGISYYDTGGLGNGSRKEKEARRVPDESAIRERERERERERTRTQKEGESGRKTQRRVRAFIFSALSLLTSSSRDTRPIKIYISRERDRVHCALTKKSRAG